MYFVQILKNNIVDRKCFKIEQHLFNITPVTYGHEAVP